MATIMSARDPGHQSGAPDRPDHVAQASANGPANSASDITRPPHR